MAKQSPTKDVFDRITERVGPKPPAPESDAVAGSDDTPAESDTPAKSHTAAEPTECTASAGRRRHCLLRALVGVVCLGLVGLAAVSGWWRVNQLDDTAAAGSAALAAAQDYTVVLTSLDTNDIDANYQQALDGATGEFRDQYSQGSAQLRQVLIDNHAAARGIVTDAGIKSATKTRVEVLLFVDQSVTNAANPSPRIDRNRVQMTMELVDGRWLASRVELV